MYYHIGIKMTDFERNLNLEFKFLLVCDCFSALSLLISSSIYTTFRWFIHSTRMTATEYTHRRRLT